MYFMGLIEKYVFKVKTNFQMTMLYKNLFVPLPFARNFQITRNQMPVTKKNSLIPCIFSIMLNLS